MGREDLAVTVGQYRVVLGRYYQSSSGEEALERLLQDQAQMLPLVKRALGFNG